MTITALSIAFYHLRYWTSEGWKKTIFFTLLSRGWIRPLTKQFSFLDDSQLPTEALVIELKTERILPLSAPKMLYSRHLASERVKLTSSG